MTVQRGLLLEIGVGRGSGEQGGNMGTIVTEQQ